MTARQLLHKLSKLSQKRLDQEVIAVHGASGVSYSVCGPYKWAVRETDHAGVLVDMELDEEYVGLSVD